METAVVGELDRWKASTADRTVGEELTELQGVTCQYY